VTYGPARARYERRKRHRQRYLANAGMWNVLSIVFSVATVLLVAWFVKGLFLPELSTNIFTKRASLPINTLADGSVPFVIPPTQKPGTKTTSAPEELKTTTPNTNTTYTFDLQAAPQSISANLFRSEQKCNWMGVAGQTFDLQGRPVPGITVQVMGPLYGKEIKFLSITGAAPWYGAGGYEVFLSDKPFVSKDIFQVSLVDQAGRSLSPLIPFSTFSECEKNLVIINFHQIK